MPPSTSPARKGQLSPPPIAMYERFSEAEPDEALLGGHKTEGTLPTWHAGTPGVHKRPPSSGHGRSRLTRGLLTAVLGLVLVGAYLRWASPGPDSPAGTVESPSGPTTTSPGQLLTELDVLYNAVHGPIHQTTMGAPPVAASDAPLLRRPSGAHPTRPTPTPAAPVLALERPTKPQTPVRVGRRQHAPLYHGRGCSSSELLASLAAAHIRPDGGSRKAFNYTSDVLPLDDFQFSYDLEGCPAPHRFSPEETCDLLNAFGGVYLRGDSLMRQFAQGIYLLLAGSFDIVRDDHEECSGNQVFTHGKECKFHSIFDGRHLDQVCGNQVAIVYQQLFAWIEGPVDEDYLTPPSPSPSPSSTLVKRKRPSVAQLAGRLQGAYKSFIASLTPAQRQLSPVYIHGTGIHYYFDTAVSKAYHVDPWMRTAAAARPRPLSLWVLNPAPGRNKPKQYEAGQGVTATRKYNEKMKVLLSKTNGGQNEAAKGAWAALDFYNSTDGASSFDGTHYSYQVAMERAQMVLNYLDAVWGEVVELGGLVEH